ncbi:Galectin-related protein [Hondaea fermentalgiana]|uniref:Galectin-related protein n=1 Tax=Hondaea fermentalgiana TaxID=2315210 RepID=A0A2R5GR69_9STRA|nr:Galectin-related protein [Hondaea fermentalgiana]|eukprot:GBG32809.1 Galectin-related protein [Hondaea fermentalgiana]
MTTIRIKVPRGGAAAASNVDIDISSSSEDEDEVGSNADKSLTGDAENTDQRKPQDRDYEPERLETAPGLAGRGSAASAGAGLGRHGEDDDDDDDNDSIDKYMPASAQSKPAAGHDDTFSNLSVPERYQPIIHELTEQERRLLDKFVRSKKLVLKMPVRMEQVAAARRAQENERKRRGNTFTDSDRVAGLVKRPRINVGGPLADGAHPQSPPQQPMLSQRGAQPRTPTQLDRGKSIAALSTHYDDAGVLMLSDWRSTESKEPLVIELPNLQHEPNAAEGSGNSQSVQSGNTVVVWGTFPDASERFCINLAPSTSYKESDPNTVFLYHFNPRDGWGKKQIQQNAFVHGKWGRADRAVQSMPIVKNKRFELRITATPKEFLIFLDGRHFDTFANRADPRYLQPGRSLYLIVPLVEDHYGDKEDVKIHGVWWGHRPARMRSPSHSGPAYSPNRRFPSGPGGMSGPRPGPGGGPGGGYGGGPGFHSRGPPHPGGHRRPRSTPQLEEKVLFVSGLPKDTGSAFNELLRLFEHYGVEKDHNGQPRIRVIEGKDFAFVTLREESSVAEAIRFLDGKPGQAGLTLSVTRARKRPGYHG